MGISEEILRALDYSSDIVVYTTIRGTIKYVNQKFLDKYGYTRKEIIGKNPSVLNTGYHDNEFYRDLWNTISNGETWNGVFRNKTKDGTLIWEKACINPVMHNGSQIVGYLAVKSDITKKREIDAQLMEEHIFMEELFANAPVGIAICEPIYGEDKELKDLLVIKANPTAGNIVGRLGLVGLTLNVVLPGADTNKQRLKMMLQRKFSFEAHLEELGKHLRFRSFPFGNDHLCIFFYDVSHYKSTISALATSEERYFKLVEDAPALISRFDNEGYLSYVNTEYCKVFGVEQEALLGQNFLIRIPEDERDRVWKAIQKLTPEQPYSELEYRIETESGETRWLHRLDRALLDANGRIFEYQSVGVDFTSIKLSEQKLKQNEAKLKKLNNTKDKLFSIIAHDVKNPFNAILGFSTLLRNNLEAYSEEQIKEYVGRIQSASENVYKLLDDLLVWAKSQLGQIQVNYQCFKLNNLVAESFESFEPLALEKNIRLIDKVDKTIEIRADVDMLRFVVRNLIHNAIKFTKEGGCVECSSDISDNEVMLSVKDTGIGIRAERLKVIFDVSEFMATSGTSEEKGTGLGLHLAKEMVETNKGRIEVKSEVDVGTEFKIFFSHVE